MAGFDPDAYLAKPPAFDPDAYLASMPAAPDAIPQQRRGGLKASFAGLADTMLGLVPQATAEVGYAGVRALEGLGLAKPGQAARGRKAVLEQYGTPVGTALGVTGTQDYQNEASQRLMQFIGEYAGKGADWISQQTGLPKADVENMMFSLSLAAPKAGGKVMTAGGKAIEAAVPVVKQVATQVAESKPGQAVIKPLQERQARIQEANVAKSFENAAQIDAANLAVKHGIVIDPAVSNPTISNRVKSGLVKSTNFSENASKINDAKFTLLAKQDIGVPATAELNAKTFEQALDKHSKPYNVVRSIPRLAPDSATLNQINSLRIDRPAIGGEASAAAVNSLVDEALAKVAEGRSGAEIITDIRKLRKDANSVYSTQQKSGVPDPTLLAKADASIGVANALENLIEANVQDPKLLGELRKARSEMAKIYDYERATNMLTGRIDPQALVKMAKEGKPLTGIAADIAKIASVFPEIAQTGQTGAPAWAKNLTRSGTGGTLGMAGAALIGAPLIPGAVVGAGLGYVGGGIAARRMTTPAYQAAHALPQDFRPPVNNLRPAPPSTTQNLPVVYDYRNALLTPDQIPNWVFGRNVPEGQVQVGVPNTPQLSAPSPESTQAFVNQQRAYEYNRAKAEAEAAAAQQSAREAAARKPTSGEVVLEVDPVTGKLRNVSQGVKGATPETIQSTGHSLTSAAEKVAGGQKFAMSAEEKIAWDKTKVDLASVDAGLAKLSDKALAEKAMDRAWVEETIAKAKQKAAAFEEIAKRSKDAQEVMRAKAERERLMDVLEMLEPKMSQGRPVRSGAQGPKTREAIRNQLSPKNQNQLRND